jgi:uroporphyrinogen-III decarboxylase
MNSKERVTAAINREPVDRVPLGFYAVDYDTVERVLGRKTFVRNKIAIQMALWDGRRDEVAQGLKEDVVEFYRKIDCADILLPKEARLLPSEDYEAEMPKKIAENKWEDREGRIYQVSPEANEIYCVHDPTLEALEYSVGYFENLSTEVVPPDPSVFEVFDHVVGELGEERYVASPTGGVTALTLLGGMEKGLLMYALRPEVIAAANRHSVAVQNQLDEHYIRPGAPGVLMEQDMGSNTGPLISPAAFREICFPYLKQRVQHVKQFVAQVIFHNDGNNVPLIPMLIESGIDCYESIQDIPAMEIGRLKAMFGAQLCFWGGVSVDLLIRGTPEQVRQAVRDAMERYAPGGGFILGPSHSIAMNTKYENFMAMLDEFVALRDRF